MWNLLVLAVVQIHMSCCVALLSFAATQQWIPVADCQRLEFQCYLLMKIILDNNEVDPSSVITFEVASCQTRRLHQHLVSMNRQKAGVLALTAEEITFGLRALHVTYHSWWLSLPGPEAGEGGVGAPRPCGRGVRGPGDRPGCAHCQLE